MIRWEYQIVRNMLADNLEATLNRLGHEGWEVVSITGIDGAFTLTGNKLYAVLKREVGTTAQSDQIDMKSPIEELRTAPTIELLVEEFGRLATKERYARCR